MAAHWYAAAMILVAAPTTAVLSKPVVVDQVAPVGPTGAASEFVQLRNVSAEPVDISNWHLSACVGKRIQTLGTMPLGTVLAPKGQQGQYFLVASSYYDNQLATPDLDFQAGLVPANGGVRLTDVQLTTVDSVGFAPESPCTEVAPATVPPYGAVRRDANGTDTGDNAVDFTSRPPEPHNSLG